MFRVTPSSSLMAQTPESEKTGGYKIPAMLAFSEIATSLSSDADLEQLLERFLQTLIRLAGAGGGAVRVLTADGAHMRMVGAIGLPQEVIEREYLVPAGCGGMRAGGAGYRDQNR